ncbi:MAG: class I SAM-dependent RNA methyltransferase [Myxococcota bacterium]
MGGRSSKGTAVGHVERIGRRGEATVSTPRGPVLAAFGLPGERVRLGRIRREGRHLRGRIEEVLEASPSRVDPPCPLYARCGGCPLMPMAAAAEREHKRTLVQRAVDPGRAPSTSVEWVGADRELAYRRRARLHYRRREGGLQLGYRRPRSHALVDVPACPVLVPGLNDALAQVREQWLPHLEGEGEIRLGLGEGGRAVGWLGGRAAQPPGAYDAARRLVESGAFAGVAMRVGGATAEAAFGDPREWATGADGEPLIGPPGGFSQANEEVNRALVERVCQWAVPEGARVLELYAGHGNLTVALARRAASLVAVEQDAGAAAACRDNLARRGLEATVQHTTAERGAAGPPVDAAVLDPPREGAREALAGLQARNPLRIVYVSCDPFTLGRDLRVLGAAGYHVRRAAAFDMFPQTAHVEAVAFLDRGA